MQAPTTNQQITDHYPLTACVLRAHKLMQDPGDDTEDRYFWWDMMHQVNEYRIQGGIPSIFS